MIHRNNRMPCIIRTTSSARKVGGAFLYVFGLNFRLNAFRCSQAKFTASALHTCGHWTMSALFTPLNSSFCLLTALQALRRPSKTSPLLSHIVARDELRRELWAAAGVAKVLGDLVLPQLPTATVTDIGTPFSRNVACPVAKARFKSSQSCPLDQILNVGMLADKEFIVDTRKC